MGFMQEFFHNLVDFALFLLRLLLPIAVCVGLSLWLAVTFDWHAAAFFGLLFVSLTMTMIGMFTWEDRRRW